EAKTIFHVEEARIVEKKKETNGGGIASTDPVFLSVNKEIFEGKISPKANRSFTVALYNDSSHTVTARGIVIEPVELEGARFGSFVEITPERVEIEPYKSKMVRITVRSPESIPEGDKYVRIDFFPESVDGRPVPEELQKAFGTSTLLVLDNIKGTQVEKVNLTGIEFFLEEYQKGILRPRVVVHFKNTGNTHLQPSCSVTLSQILEEEIANINEGAVAVKPGAGLTLVSKESPDLFLPGEEGMLVLESRDTLNPGKYKLVVVIQNQGKEIFREEKTLELRPTR
ncbi:MAG: hypothetical protein HPY68_08475, partial [Candidatus Atribacteria bacterium]|nr:hypothetical protein [Candidatus Atribacteria bacterium]